jgi:hypothetical protein
LCRRPALPGDPVAIGLRLGHGRLSSIAHGLLDAPLSRSMTL